jgi:hypothetical protein
VNFFDMADVYAKGEAERAMGKALAELPRHRLVISTKLFWPMSEDVNDRGLSRKHIMESVEKSLKRIGTDYVDVYFCHRFDPETPVEETIRAMTTSSIRPITYWGTSEWTGAQIHDVPSPTSTAGTVLRSGSHSSVARAQSSRTTCGLRRTTTASGSSSESARVGTAHGQVRRTEGLALIRSVAAQGLSCPTRSSA